MRDPPCDRARLMCACGKASCPSCGLALTYNEMLEKDAAAKFLKNLFGKKVDAVVEKIADESNAVSTTSEWPTVKEMHTVHQTYLMNNYGKMPEKWLFTFPQFDNLIYDDTVNNTSTLSKIQMKPNGEWSFLGIPVELKQQPLKKPSAFKGHSIDFAAMNEVSDFKINYGKMPEEAKSAQKLDLTIEKNLTLYNVVSEIKYFKKHKGVYPSEILLTTSQYKFLENDYFGTMQTKETKGYFDDSFGQAKIMGVPVEIVKEPVGWDHPNANPLKDVQNAMESIKNMNQPKKDEPLSKKFDMNTKMQMRKWAAYHGKTLWEAYHYLALHKWFGPNPYEQQSSIIPKIKEGWEPTWGELGTVPATYCGCKEFCADDAAYAGSTGAELAEIKQTGKKPLGNPEIWGLPKEWSVGLAKEVSAFAKTHGFNRYKTWVQVLGLIDFYKMPAGIHKDAPTPISGGTSWKLLDAMAVAKCGCSVCQHNHKTVTGLSSSEFASGGMVGNPVKVNSVSSSKVKVNIKDVLGANIEFFADEVVIEQKPAIFSDQTTLSMKLNFKLDQLFLHQLSGGDELSYYKNLALQHSEISKDKSFKISELLMEVNDLKNDLKEAEKPKTDGLKAYTLNKGDAVMVRADLKTAVALFSEHAQIVVMRGTPEAAPVAPAKKKKAVKKKVTDDDGLTEF